MPQLAPSPAVNSCPELFLLRHGQTVWNVEGRIQGHGDSPLTGLGQVQARAMGAVLAREIVDPGSFAMVASPAPRAAATARLALAPLGRDADHDARLREVGHGAWEGLTKPEVFAHTPGAEAGYEADPFGWHFTAPEGESFEAVVARLDAFLAGLDRPTVLVAHGMSLRVLRGRVLGLDAAGMADLPGGQGVVWHIRDGVHRVIAP